jgi:pimeloyl-ACP methyl ester carboxylesterase
MEPRTLLHDAKGHGEPIVLVPGGLTGWLSWIPHQERLAERYRAIRVQPIHNELGSAGVPGDPGYTSGTERESLRLTLYELNLDSLHLAGWSGGGRAAIEFAIVYPQRVGTLALVEPAAHWVLGRHGERPDAVERGEAFLNGLVGRAVSEADLADFLVLAGFADTTEAARADPSWERWMSHRMALSWQGALDRSARSIDDLARIACPVLLVKGTRTTDWAKRVVDALGERLADATVIELEGGHACHIQSIDAFLEAFQRHLRRAP